jgi:hypothetical protein
LDAQRKNLPRSELGLHGVSTTSRLGTINGHRIACILVGTEVGALVAFFSYALVAKDIYYNIEEFNPGDELVRYVEWNTCAREALLTVILLWFVAIARAIHAYARARESVSAVEGYRQEVIVTATLLLPVAGFVAAFIFGLYLPRD